MALPPIGNSKKEDKSKGLPSLGTLPSIDDALPSLDNKEDSSDFQPLSYEEQEALDKEDEQQEYSAEYEKKEYIPSDDDGTVDKYMPRYGNDVGPLNPPEDDDKFINKNKRKIIPTGARASKVKARDFDSRKNSMIAIKLVRLFVFVVIIGLFALGIKNTYFPVQIYTPDEIAQLAYNAVGDTGFPLEEGRALAQEFLKYYISSDVSDMTNKQILDNFYFGKDSNTNGQVKSTKRDFPDTRQKALSEPILFEEGTYFPYAGFYKFSVLVSDSDGSVIGNDSKLKAHWMSFAINIYYDENTKSLSIHPDSPTLIPGYKIANSSIIPFENALGNGTEDSGMVAKLTPTIDGFVVAYSKVTDKSHNEIDQYIPASQPIDLISGFGGDVKIANTPDRSIVKKVYSTDDPNEWKVDVRVEWLNNQVTGVSSVFTSRYVMTIQRTSDDVYLVTKFAPYVYEKKKENN